MFLISLGDVTEWLFNVIGDLFNLVWAIICSTIYGMIAAVFNIFNTLSQLNILSDFGIEDIYQRISMIIIIVMAFYITFEMVKYVVQPDMINDKSKGASNMVKKIVLVILLLAFTPKLFSIAYDLQGRVLRGHVIEKVILGEKYVEADNDHWLKTAGSNFSANLFGMFFTLDTEKCPDGASTSSACSAAQENIDGLLSFISSGFNINGIGNLLFLCESTLVLLSNMFNGHLINFSGLLALGVGIYVLWSLLVYSVELANRYFQLMYLQITAPIAIIGHLTPSKDSMLSKWFKQCITTYLDLFIRILIINFVVFLCSLLHDKLFANAGAVGSAMSELTSGTDWTGGSIFWVYLFLIIGLFRFVSKAPKLLKELFPSSGGAASSGFSLTEPFKSAVGTGMHAIHGASRAIGGVVGAYTGVNTARKSAKNGALADQSKRSKLWSGMKAGYHGAKTGFSKGGSIKKANEAAIGSVQRDEDIVLKKGTIGGHDFQGNKYQRIAIEQDRKIADLESMTSKKKAVSSAIGDIKFRNQMDSVGNAISSSGNAAAAMAWDGKKKEAEKYARQFATGKISDVEFQRKIDTMVSDFKTTYNVNDQITLDLEINSTSKWAKVSSFMDDAKKAAQDINGTKWKDKEGNEHTIIFNDATFADDIGSIADDAGTAADQEKISEEYKMAHANANGSGGSGGGGHH